MLPYYVYAGIKYQRKYLNQIKDTLLAKSICDKLKLDFNQLLGETRKIENVNAKLILYADLKRIHKLSLTRIGAIFNRNHSTITHALKQYDYFSVKDKEFIKYEKAIREGLPYCKPRKKKNRFRLAEKEGILKGSTNPYLNNEFINK